MDSNYWFRNFHAAKIGLFETDQCTTEQGVGRIPAYPHRARVGLQTSANSRAARPPGRRGRAFETGRRMGLAITHAARQLTLIMVLLAMLAASCTGNQPLDRHPGPVDIPLGPDNKQLWWIPLGTGAEQSLLETTVYRPSGPGPFPLVTINHGKPRPGSTDPQAMHPGYSAAAHWFVNRGFAVAVPMRRGYGLSQGQISDTAGPCSDRDYFATALKTAADMESVVAYLRNQRFVDRNRVIVVGQSYGGLGALGVAYDKVEGVIGIINFAGGAGSNRRRDLQRARTPYRRRRQAWRRQPLAADLALRGERPPF
jgi:dienelactone hydrolase